MKSQLRTLTATCLASITLAVAGPNHTHEKLEAGPNGGRLITSVDPHAEFWVTADRKVQITFVGDDNQQIAPSGQIIAVTTGERSAPVKMTFTESNGVLVSEEAVPEGNNFPVVVQIQPTPDADKVVERFTLNLSECPECKLPEYACTCAHTH